VIIAKKPAAALLALLWDTLNTGALTAYLFNHGERDFLLKVHLQFYTDFNQASACHATSKFRKVERMSSEFKNGHK